ncbi:MAG: DUF4250 domain-containing protein [Cellulosilyticaceae bacterium]
MENLDKKDPYLMLSILNMKLRDECSSLIDLCKTYNLDQVYVEEKMKKIDYTYNQDTNQFI